MRIVRVKNVQDTEDTYCSHIIQSQEYYTIPNEYELDTFADDDKVSSHLWNTDVSGNANPKIVINNGSEDLSPVEGDIWLKGNHIEQVIPTSDLVLDWATLKAFFESVKTVASINYVDIGSHYYIWVSYRGQRLFVPKLKKNSSDGEDFEDNYKDTLCNDPEHPKVRLTTCKVGRKLHSRYICFCTSSGAVSPSGGPYDNTDYTNTDYGDIVYVMKDSEGETTTNTSEAVETWVDWEPPYNYEIFGGDLDIPSTLSGEESLWESHILAVPDVPQHLGGCVQFIANPRLKWKKGKTLQVDCSVNPAELLYSNIYHTNKIRIIIKHPAGEVKEFQVNFRIYR